VFTAQVTPKLKLMRPLDSDQFESSDFYDTFTALDARPGIALVDSYAGLGTLASTNAYGVNQHGLMALDRHNNALWWYSNPSGTGTWKRANSTGSLFHGYQGTNVVTKATTGNGSLVSDTNNFTVPGGRALQINFDFSGDNTSGSNGLGYFTLLDGSTSLSTRCVRLGAPVGNSGTANSFSYIIPAAQVTPESTHRFRVYARSVPGSAANGGGGTTTIRYSTLDVTEI
jgi:hypothetical protein